MKRIGIIMLAITVLFSFSACAGNKATCGGEFVQVPAIVAKAPAPPAAPKATVAPAPKTIPAPITVLFDFDKANILPSEKAKIDQAIKILKEDPNAVADLGGYADPIGTTAYNMALSQLRANTVRAAMVAAGIDQKRINTKAYGKTDLAKSGLKGKDENKVNRRVVIVFKDK